MQVPVFVGLAVLWMIVLGPDLVRKVRTRSSGDSIANFSKQLSTLEQRNPQRIPQRRPVQPAPEARRDNVVSLSSRRSSTAAPAAETRPTSQAQRRQEIIVALGGLVMLSLLASVTFGGPLLLVHLTIDVLFLGYLTLVLRAGRTRPATSSSVSYLPARPLSVSIPVQRRSASR